VTCPTWFQRHWIAVDVAIAVFFVLLDTTATLLGATWWPARPGPLAWSLLGLQALVCCSLVVRRRAPLTVMAIMAAFTLAVTLLIWPIGALTPAHTGNVWAPYATALAAYGPVLYRQDRRTAFIAIGAFAIIVGPGSRRSRSSPSASSGSPSARCWRCTSSPAGGWCRR
jgi:hypothetical protein